MERSATNPQSPSPHPSTSNWSISKAWGQGCAESFDHGDHTSVDTSLPECFCSGCAWQGIKPFWTHWVSVCLSCSGFPAALHTWIWTLITWHFTTFLKYTHARTLKCVLCIVALVLTPPKKKKKIFHRYTLVLCALLLLILKALVAFTAHSETNESGFCVIVLFLCLYKQSSVSEKLSYACVVSYRRLNNKAFWCVAN